MRKFYIILLIVLFFVLWNSVSFGYKNEPDGFRGIKWETLIDSLPDMRYISSDSSRHGGIDYYVRKDDIMKIGEASLDRIEYGFWRKKFFQVFIFTEGYHNWTNLRDSIFEKFGRGEKSNRYIERYTWFGDITGLALEYWEISNEVSFMMVSDRIWKEQQEYDKQKSKEGAEKGF